MGDSDGLVAVEFCPLSGFRPPLGDTPQHPTLVLPIVSPAAGVTT
jgi:hypothetical protein